MKIKVINLVLSVFVFVSLISIFTTALALTAEDIGMLLKAGIISPSQASVLNKSISTPASTLQVPENDLNYNCASINIDIEYGHKDTIANNNTVSVLQNFLNKNGYLTSTPTGYFGNLTLLAVKAFQSANGINPTGYVGPMTRAKINNLDCNVSTVVTPPVITTPIVSTTSPVVIKFDSLAPTITLTADPAKVMVGEPTTLEWSSYNTVDECKITSKDSSGNTFSGVVEISGSKSTGPINKTTTYTIICYNRYGVPGSKSIVVEVVSANMLDATNQPKYVQAATINSISPSTANRGDTVTIIGSGFVSTNEVIFDGAKVDNSLILSQSSTSISFKIPEYKQCLTAYCPPLKIDTNIETGGRKIIQVSNINGFSNDFVFTLPSKIITIPGTPDLTIYSSKLVINSINPTSGNRGDTVTVSGSGFSSDSIVLFGGFKVADNLIISRTNNSILFTVPPYQMGCTLPEYEACPRLPLPGTGLTIETGGIKDVYVMNTGSKSTSTSAWFTLPSKKITY